MRGGRRAPAVHHRGAGQVRQARRIGGEGRGLRLSPPGDPDGAVAGAPPERVTGVGARLVTLGEHAERRVWNSVDGGCSPLPCRSHSGALWPRRSLPCAPSASSPSSRRGSWRAWCCGPAPRAPPGPARGGCWPPRGSPRRRCARGRPRPPRGSRRAGGLPLGTDRPRLPDRDRGDAAPGRPPSPARPAAPRRRGGAVPLRLPGGRQAARGRPGRPLVAAGARRTGRPGGAVLVTSAPWRRRSPSWGHRGKPAHHGRGPPRRRGPAHRRPRSQHGRDSVGSVVPIGAARSRSPPGSSCWPSPSSSTRARTSTTPTGAAAVSSTSGTYCRTSPCWPRSRPSAASR